MNTFIDHIAQETKADSETVRKVIETMRVPTPKMLEMANHVFADRIWRSMVDEALRIDTTLQEEKFYKDAK